MNNASRAAHQAAAIPSSVWAKAKSKLGSWPAGDWLWRALGLTTGSVAVVVVSQQLLESNPAAVQDLQAKVRKAGQAAQAWLRSSVQRITAPTPQPIHAPSRALQPGTMQGYAARWLADWCSQPERSHVAVALGGGPLLDWLVDTATSHDAALITAHKKSLELDVEEQAEQQQAQRALTFILQSDATAPLLAERPGAIPRLMQHCLTQLESTTTASQIAPTTSSDQSLQELYDALKQRAAAGLVHHDETTHVSDAMPAWSSYASVPGLTVGPDWDAWSDDVETMATTLNNQHEHETSIAAMVQDILGSVSTGSSNRWGRGEAPLSDLESVLSMLQSSTFGNAADVDTVSNAAATSEPPAAAILSTDFDVLRLDDTGLPDSPRTGSANLQHQWLAASWLASWAEAHPGNRDKLTELNVAAVVSEVAGQVSGRPASADITALQTQLIRLVQAMVQPSNFKEYSMSMQTLTSSQSSISHDSSTVDSSITNAIHSHDNSPSSSRSYSSKFVSTSSNGERVDEMRQGGTSGIVESHMAGHHLAGCLKPLLFILADAVVDKDSDRLKSALNALQLLLLQGGQPVAAAASSEPLLPLLYRLTKEIDDIDVQCAVVHTVAALAHTPSALGDVAANNDDICTWREWLLTTLCQEDGPSMQRLQQACSYTLAELAALPGVPGLQVTHYWLAALLACLGTRVWPYNAVIYRGPQDPLFNLASKGDEDTSAEPNGNQSQSASAAVDARALLDAVPVLPSHITAVAAALEAASAAVVEEHEVPPEFDPSATGLPAGLARDFYKQAAHAVDMIMAEKCVCQALEVLSALVAADPAKQQWLMDKGVLPLLYRLSHPISDPSSPASKPASANEVKAVAATLLDAEMQSKALPLDASNGDLEQNSSSSTATQSPTTVGTSKATLISRLYRWLPTMPWKRNNAKTAAGGDAARNTAGLGAMDAKTVVEEDHHEPHDVYTDHEGPYHLCLRRQVARLLAMLAIQPAARPHIAGPDWMPWLHSAASDSDCRLASHATKALLNLEAFRRKAPRGDVRTNGHLLNLMTSNSTSTSPSQPPAPVYLDMIHLLDPGAKHLWSLSKHSSRPASGTLLEGMQGRPQAATKQTQQDLFKQLGINPLANSNLSQAPSSAESPVGPVMGLNVVKHSRDHTHDVAFYDSQLLSQRSAAKEDETSKAAQTQLTSRHLPAQAGSTIGALSSAMGDVVDSIISTSYDSAAYVGSVTAAACDVLLNAVGLPSTFPTTAALANASPSVQSQAGHRDSSLTLDTKRSFTHPFLRQQTAYAAEYKSQTTESSTAQPGMHILQQSDVSLKGDSLAGTDTQGVTRVSTADSNASVFAEGREANMALDVQNNTDIDVHIPKPDEVPKIPYDSSNEPLVDVVFIHGIRGGPFITWRKPGSVVKGKSAVKRSMAHLTQSHCWPSDWLSKDAPYARMLTIEYLAPVSGWEGESLPLEATVERVMAQLEAAGVGRRPLVFVAHSMGGLLIKEMLIRSLREQQSSKAGQATPARARLAEATKGIIFFATPHFGSGMAAMGWKLRHMPYAAPAPALARLTPGPHLVELNEGLRELHDKKGVKIVSVVEGQATQLAPVLPKVLIVPEASAYPGFGERMLMPNHDHISLCKPADKQAGAYLVVIDMIAHAAELAVKAASSQQARR